MGPVRKNIYSNIVDFTLNIHESAQKPEGNSPTVDSITLGRAKGVKGLALEDGSHDDHTFPCGPYMSHHITVPQSNQMCP